ncbi:hypothetical protein CAP35_13900 [Chitinophagaceae bacterium IBVUCB1]|nr:hypothetical protein CAP35_13900 [Chitinophagaceae bacterium IBVUCB1]
MKLNKFSAANMSHIRQKASTIRLQRKGANIISDLAVESIGLKAGDKVSLVQDEDNPSDWYLMIDEQEGFTLRADKDSKHLSFNCAALSNTVLDACFDNVFSATFKLITEPNKSGGVNYYPIILAGAIVREYAQPDGSDGGEQEDQ